MTYLIDPLVTIVVGQLDGRQTSTVTTIMEFGHLVQGHLDN